MKIPNVIVVLLAIAVPVSTVSAQEVEREVAELRQLVEEMRRDYENRISDLEARLARSERVTQTAQRDADEAFELAEQTAIDQSSGSSAANTFNPSIGSVFVARFGDFTNGWEEIPGFIPGGELGPGSSGFSIGETDLNMKATVDSSLFGNLTLAIENDDGQTEVVLEEAWIQSTGLASGVTLTGGRFFSDAGYLNKFHRHADDFSDRPLPYQAFYGGQYIADGVQARWIAPTEILVEVGAELDWGAGFPTTANGNASPGGYTVFTNIGADLGDSHSWQFGLSLLSSDIVNRDSGAPGQFFTGDSDLTTVDFVWKWAPLGNPTVHNFKAQAEYFRRSENGVFAGLPYDGDQTGWYLQAIWQFMQRWRAGYRHDTVEADNGPLFAGTILEDPGRSSKRDTFMVDWSLSEFSRLRMQYVNDQVLPQSEDQLFLQYIVGVGAHAAHEY